MKYAFTTLSCPEWDLETALGRGRELGFHGIDFRGIGPHRLDPERRRYVKVDLDITRHPLFTTGLDRTRGLIADSGLAVAGLSSGVSFAAKPAEEQSQALDEGRRYIELARKLDCGVVRVFAGNFDEKKLGLDEARRKVVAGLRTLAPVAVDLGVWIGVETHDRWTATERLRAVLEEVGSSAVGAIWDVNHPYRSAGETPEATWANIGRWVRYTHWKDSVESSEGGITRRLMGEGTLPLEGFVKTLKEGGYDGYLALEVERLWHPDMEPAEEQLPRFIEVMRGLVG